MKLSLLSSVVGLAIFATGCGSAAEGSETGAASAVTAAASASDTEATEPSNFAEVHEGLYRGGHPDHGNLLYLQGLGVTTIVDLEIGDYVEATPSEIADEVADATAMGFTVVREPLSAFQPFVNDDEMNRTMDLLSNPDAGKIYVHCRHGQDRTGMVIGLERVLIEGWEPADAYSEMLAYGFHPLFLGLRHYFDEKTGYTGS